MEDPVLAGSKKTDPIAGTSSVDVQRVRAGHVERGQDSLAIEEPLEIRVSYVVDGRRRTDSLYVTMRTPGRDLDLAAGFLFTEQVIQSPGEIKNISHCVPAGALGAACNTVRVDLVDGVDFNLDRLQRNFYASSSCGVCGKTSLEALEINSAPRVPDNGFRVAESIVHSLPDLLNASQPVFRQTGGLHAAALFDDQGTLAGCAEDVGRHNAVDKVIGTELRGGRVPISDRLLLVSGRSSFEILQKALAAQIPIVAAVGPPSSLALDLAKRFGITLLGFVREGRFNIYAGAERIAAGDG
ncbi:MAG: formate dehydrogenase accessory sulfurtransferase FdhD [Acidimicrobiia bacterium]